MRKMFDMDPWEGLERREAAPPLRILETVRSFFGRLPFGRRDAQVEDESVITPEDEG